MTWKISNIPDNTTSAKNLNGEIYQGNGSNTTSTADLVSGLSDGTFKEADPEKAAKNDKPRSGRCSAD